MVYITTTTYCHYNYIVMYRIIVHDIIALFRKWFSFAKLNPCMGFPPEIFPGVETTGRPVFLLPHLEAMETLPSLAISALRSVATVACCSSVGVYARRQGHGLQPAGEFPGNFPQLNKGCHIKTKG